MTYFTSAPRISTALFTPAVNVYQNDREVVLEAELPGVKKETIKVEVKQGVLEISAAARQPRHPEGWEVVHKERALEDLRRSFRLGEGLDAGKVAAKYEDGLLTLTIPRKEDAKPRAIEIR